MEKNTVRSRTCYQRLLIFCIAICWYPLGISGYTVDDSIELRIGTGPFFIENEYEIEVFIHKDSPYIIRNKDIPRLILDQKSQCAVLLQSSASIEFDGLHLRYVYRLIETGSFPLVFLLQWKHSRIELNPVTLTVHEPLLSEKTVFSWRLYTIDGTPIPENGLLEQGQSYFLFLTAAFYAPNYSTSSVPYTSDATTIALPPELKYIDCPAPENAVLEHAPAKILLPNSTFCSDLSSEEYILAAFTWTPLKTGLHQLPDAQIVFNSGSMTSSRAVSYSILPYSTAPTEQEDSTTLSSVHAAFIQSSIGGEASNSSASHIRETVAAAHKIAEYRQQETMSFFPFAIRRERKKLEAALHIIKPVPVYPRGMRVVVAFFATASSVWTVVAFIKKQKWAVIAGITATFVFSGATAMLLYKTRQAQGVCITPDHTAVVRRIPETVGSAVHHLTAGESVIIIRKAGQWYYIKTTDGISGWVSRSSIADTIGGK